MIIELLLRPIFSLIAFVIGLLPDMSELELLTDFDITGFIDFIAYGFFIFPLELFLILIGNVMFWKGTQVLWAVIEWVYRKIPGVS